MEEKLLVFSTNDLMLQILDEVDSLTWRKEINKKEEKKDWRVKVEKVRKRAKEESR